MSAQAELEETGTGLAPRGQGWFVLNACEARWRERDGRGFSLPFTGWTEHECETLFPQLGVQLMVLRPGEPGGLYHWEADQEDFLVLSGEGLLIIEGEERSLRQWDFVHCPPGARHTIVGAGDDPCVILAMGAREHIDMNCHGGGYPVDDAALRHGAGVEVETDDADVAYAHEAEPQPVRYREGWLPGA